MTRDEINIALGAVLTAMLQLEKENLPFAPEVSFYLALNMDYEKWIIVKRLLLTTELITAKFHTLILTDKGRQMAERINKHLEEVSAKQQSTT